MVKRWRDMTFEEKMKSIRDTNIALLELQEGEPDDQDTQKIALGRYEAREMSQHDLR